MRILLIDNYDSFTYNLADLLRRYATVQVVRNDAIGLEEITATDPAGIVVSPGPGRPEDSGISLPLVQRLYDRYPILGVCLGHQIIGQVCGAKVVHAARPMHGRTSLVQHTQTSVFRQLPSPLRVMRYHSLVLDPDTIPDELEVIAYSDGGEIMGIRHKIHTLVGVQFHPESVLSEGGDRMIRNWLDDICTRQARLVPLKAD
ncbi:MAG: aminodeoxychorismate/anthranilate synthase component II [Bacteroidia bacterium]